MFHAYFRGLKKCFSANAPRVLPPQAASQKAPLFFSHTEAIGQQITSKDLVSQVS
jgi:hypothetical protein